MRTHLDLFSGIGGFSLAAEACGLETIIFCERDPARQRDLAHHWPGVPIVGDINDVDAIDRGIVAYQHGQRFDWEQVLLRPKPGAAPEASGRGGSAPLADGLREQALQEFRGADANEAGWPANDSGRRRFSPFLLTAGVPCQPASAAGQRKGSADDRWLWPATLRVVERFQPDVCVFENPLGLASLALPAAIPDVDLERLRGVPGRTVCEIIQGLDLLGYDLPRDRDGVAWIPVVPAVGVGAFHLRDRMWIIARRRDFAHSKLPASERRGRQCQRGARDTESDHDSSPSAESRGTLGVCPEQFGNGASGARGRLCGPPNPSRQLPNWADWVLEKGADGITRPVKPGLRLLTDGVRGRVVKLRGFGNSIVPQVAQEIIAAIVSNEL